MAYSRVIRMQPRPHQGRGSLSFFGGAALTLLLVLVLGCYTQSEANRSATDYTDRQQSIYDRGLPLHLYDYSQDRASYIAIYDARVQGKATFSVAVPEISGAPWFACPSRGYPIPATAQLTNPDRVDYSRGGTVVTLPQAEPNGLYSGHTAATYMQCVDSDGSLYSVYSEPHVMTFPFAVVWKGDHFEKANPNDRASYTLPTAPGGQGNATTFLPTPSAATPASR